ncbi:hypothetical protein [Rhizobium sp. Root708]|uniref:hypothetical protein n=1 Tax=Rhizobium sp. Root708 TaxID=1736592 RepID=UPI000A3E57DF|nr:hypothetical protein [Rhizobium sp. Root708]
MSDPINPQRLPIDEVLADRLGLSTKEFQRYRVQNLVSVSTTSATGSDGIIVTCQLGNRIWEGVVVNGCITSEEVRFIRGKRAGGSPSMVRREPRSDFEKGKQ